MQRIKSISVWKPCRQTLNNPFLPNLPIIRPLVWELRDWNRWQLCNLNQSQHKTSQKYGASFSILFPDWYWHWYLDYWFGVLSSWFGVGVVVRTVQHGHACATSQSESVSSQTPSVHRRAGKGSCSHLRSSCTAAPNMHPPQEAERETSFCANISPEKENPWCIQVSSAFSFTSKPCRAASFHLVPGGSQHSGSKENFCSSSIPKRRERAGWPQHHHLAAGAAPQVL